MSNVIVVKFVLTVAFVDGTGGVAVVADDFAMFNNDSRSPMVVMPSSIRVALSSVGRDTSVSCSSTNF